MNRRALRRAAIAALLVGGTITGASRAGANCNLIPGTSKAFNAELGATNRPFAAPGETVEIATRDCDTGSASQGLPLAASGYVVTVVFQPASGPKHVVALSTDNDCNTALASQLSACGMVPGVGSATCKSAPESGLAIVTRNTVRYLSFNFPDTDAQAGMPADGLTLTGPAAVAITAAADPLPCSLVTTPCLQQTGLVVCVD